MAIKVLIDDAISKFEIEVGAAPNVILLGRLQLAALRKFLVAPGAETVQGEQIIRPTYKDIAIEEVDAESHLSVDRLRGNEWPVR